jgi:hypothetical protein
MNQQNTSAFQFGLYKKIAPRSGRELIHKTSGFFADLVAYSAGRLASGLAGSRAFTAAAAAQGLFQHFFIYSLDSFCHHNPS